jgi:small-conductance mechanosensitive channel
MQLVGSNRAVQILGIRLVGANAENGKKLIFTVAFLAALVLLRWIIKTIISPVIPGHPGEGFKFWSRQAVNVTFAALVILGLVSIWFDDPTRLTTAAGLVTAGLAFASQRAITSLAGYFIILRGKTFNVGDRIQMGGVRGDVIALGFMQTTIMEMGQAPGEQHDDPSMWVRGRQYTGRIVTVSNAKVLDEPVYNYSREFPYLWDEMSFADPYDCDRRRAEQIILDAARNHTVRITELSEEALKEMERRYFMRRADLEARVFYRLTDNWVEMSVRFVAADAGIRELKDGISRDILQGLDEAGIGIASGTYNIVGLPPVKVQIERQ